MTSFDVIVVGGSVGGCMTAVGFAKGGLRVLVLDRKKTVGEYKKLCTHFIQPCGLPMLRGLGLDREIDKCGGVRTKAAFHTTEGWIDPVGPYTTDVERAHAYNIERSVLDPMLRRAVDRSGAEVRYGCDVQMVESLAEWWSVSVKCGNSVERYRCRLIVAADGRRSRIARITGNEEVVSRNDRAAFFGYFRGVATPPHDRSLFLLSDREMGFLYPLAGGRTLLSVYIDKARAKRWGRREGNALSESVVSFFEELPCNIDMGSPDAESEILGYQDYPNVARSPVWRGIPFVGDAALTLDPMSGVGCGFAMVSADLLVNCATPAFGDGDFGGALRHYGRRWQEELGPHSAGIRADSMIAKDPAKLKVIYRNIVASEQLQESFIAVTGRIKKPATFQHEYLKSTARKPVAGHV